jgi:hypothetical protein
MRKGSIVKRLKKSERSFYNEMDIGAIGVVIRGPYEKNISDIIYKLRPRFLREPRYSEIKMVVDVFSNERLFKCCAVDEYERVKS